MTEQELAHRIIRHYKSEFQSHARHFEAKIMVLEQYLDKLITEFPEFDYEFQGHEALGPRYFARNMHKIVRKFEERESLPLLNCYFAFNLLRLFADWINELSDITKSDIIHDETYSTHLKLLRLRYPALITSYLDALVNELARGEFVSFAITNVGSLVDQDDIDVGVICLDKMDSTLANRILGRLQTQMLRSGLPLHFYLSETVSDNGFAVTFEEYESFLESQRSDIVVISQLLGGVYLTGDFRVYQLFEDNILERYHFGDPSTNYYHESYLLGAMQEMELIIGQRSDPHVLNPKHDAYRLIKLMLSALKTIYRIRNKNLWQITHELRLLDNVHRSLYERLERGLGFFEACRVVLQTTVVKDDESVPVQQRRHLAKVARVMGYQGQERIEPFLEEYASKLQELRDTASLILRDVIQHHLRGTEIGRSGVLYDYINIDKLALFMFLKNQDEQTIAKAFEQLDKNVEERRSRHLVQKLHALHKVSSRLFKFYLEKLYYHCPTYIEHLNDDAWFRQHRNSIRTELEKPGTFERKRQVLIDAATSEFVRLGLGRMGMTQLPDFYRQFLTFIDHLLIDFLKLCNENLLLTRTAQLRGNGQRDLQNLLAFYVTGGHGRGQIYNDDIDVVILTHPRPDRAARGLINSLINQLNGYIYQFGSKVHLHFCDAQAFQFTTIKAVFDLYEQEPPPTTRYARQILNARFLFGDPELRNSFQQKLMTTLYRDLPRFFTATLMERKKRLVQLDKNQFNIREDEGGLSDLAAVSHILKVRFQIADTNCYSILDRARELIPALASNLDKLKESLFALRRLREIYRLTVAPDDTIRMENMVEVLVDSEFNPFQDFARSPEEMQTSYQKLITQSKEQVYLVLAHFCQELGVDLGELQAPKYRRYFF